MKKSYIEIILILTLVPLSTHAIVGEVLEGTGKVVGGVGDGVERLGEKLSIRRHEHDSSTSSSANATEENNANNSNNAEPKSNNAVEKQGNN